MPQAIWHSATIKIGYKLHWQALGYNGREDRNIIQIWNENSLRRKNKALGNFKTG